MKTWTLKINDKELKLEEYMCRPDMQLDEAICTANPTVADLRDRGRIHNEDRVTLTSPDGETRNMVIDTGWLGLDANRAYRWIKN